MFMILAYIFFFDFCCFPSFKNSLWIAILTVSVEINRLVINDGGDKLGGWKSSVERVSILNGIERVLL
jgi:hypothetical protein